MQANRTVKLDETPEEQLRARIHVHLNQDGGNPSQLLEMIQIAVKDEIWKPFGMTFKQFIETPYQDGGLGWSADNLRTVLSLKHRDERKHSSKKEIIQDLDNMRAFVREALTPELGESNHAGPGRGNKNGSESEPFNAKSQGDTTYILARLKRDRPDLAERVFNSEITAHKGGKLAGFIKPRQYFVPNDIDQTIKALKRHYDPEAFEMLKQQLCNA